MTLVVLINKSHVMWEVIREERISDTYNGPIPTTALGVRRDDGFTVIREGNDDWPYYEKSGDEAFVARGKLGQCKFVANRRFQPEQYKIYLFHQTAPDTEMCRAYAKDIESAFLEGWPWEALHQDFKKSMLKYGIQNPTYTRLEEVVFITGLTEPLKAEDLNRLMYTRGFDRDFDLPRKDSSEWRLITDRRTYRTTFELEEVTRLYDIIGVQREDGFTLTLEGVTEERAEIFLCRSDAGEFRFSVKRWARGKTIGNSITHNYLLFLYWFYPNWAGNTPDNIALCRTHHEAIESALLNFPLVRMFPGYVPVNQVMFEVDHELILSDGTRPS